MPRRLSDFRATDFEFRARFWIIGGIFWLSRCRRSGTATARY